MLTPNPQQLLQIALSRCADPNMRNIIQNAKSPEQALQELCKTYPNIAQQIDGAIGQGTNPQQMVMNLLNRR